MTMDLQTQLVEIKKQALLAFETALSGTALYDEKVKFLGKTGVFTELMKSLSQLPKEQRPEAGKLVNVVKAELEEKYQVFETKIKERELHLKLASEKLDMTLPVKEEPVGRFHPVTRVTKEITEILGRLGFSVRTGPLVESDYYNFEALNIPADHPARDMQDTFFVDDKSVLRTHTSPIQIHSLESEALPLRITGVGAVFRVDHDISHLPHFHQIEGMCVDRNISMADLKGTISFFVQEFFGAELKTRFRPSFFPFTEPSAEVDCTCPVCKGHGCSMCKGSGWIEIGGCGLINPKVLQKAGIKYPDWQGFAFGFGIERMAIIKYGIDDIRLMPENDVRFLRQFPI